MSRKRENSCQFDSVSVPKVPRLSVDSLSVPSLSDSIVGTSTTTSEGGRTENALVSSETEEMVLIPFIETSNGRDNKIQNKTLQPVKSRRRRKAGKCKGPPVPKERSPLPPAKLSPEVLTSINAVSGPSPLYWSTRPHASVTIQLPESEHGGILIGTLTCELEDELNLWAVFREGKQSVHLVLLLEKLDENTAGSWFLQLEVGEIVKYLLVKIDPRLSEVPFQELEGILSVMDSPSLVKLFFCEEEKCPEIKSLQLELWAMERICKYSLPSENDNITVHLKRLVNSLVKILYPDCTLKDQTSVSSQALSILDSNSSVVDQVQQFYKSIQWHRTTDVPPLMLPAIPGLLATLRGYQRQAVAWMLEREDVREGADEETKLHILWRKLPMKSTSSSEVFFNPYTARFSPVFFPRQPWPKGGILADEMGLGKTVEMLALILAHRWSGTYPNAHETHSHANSQSDSSSHATPINVGTGGSVGDCGLLPTINGEEVMCVCGALEAKPEESMIQCQRCLKLQHVTCSSYFEGDEEFVCTKCLFCEPLPCKTTLIVCPEAIFKQWKEEIEYHTEQDSLKVLMYEGVTKHYVSPLKMSSCDIVLTSYETLQSEIYHVTCLDFDKRLRCPKRFGYPPSPLPALHWWRICLDEAQMVESVSVKAAKMMQRLTAVNRWCVSGTPIQRDLRDLYGLLVFLAVDPYHNNQWYQKFLWQPFQEGKDVPMFSLFSHLMWRNSKADVADQLQLPEQMEQIHWVTFNNVEEYFYKRQQETCESGVCDIFKRVSADTVLSNMGQDTTSQLLTPVQSLRQACCTPQIVRSGYHNQNHSKTPVTMDVLLSKLTQQAKVEAREALRQLVSTLNGLAGLHTLDNELAEAESYYRKAMSVWTAYKEHEVECDRLQRVHTMENLAILLKSHPRTSNEAGHSPNDGALMDEAKQLRIEYSKKADTNVKGASKLLFLHKETVRKARREAKQSVLQLLDKQKGDTSQPDIGETGPAIPEFPSEDPDTAHDENPFSICDHNPLEDIFPPWWKAIMEWCSNNSKCDDLLQWIRLEISSNRNTFLSTNLKYNFQDMHSIDAFFSLKIYHIECFREEALASLKALFTEPSLEQVRMAVQCHMEPGRRRYRLRCDCCKTEGKTVKYEAQLFSRRVEHGAGCRFQSAFELLIKCLLSFAKRNGLPKDLVDAGQLVVDYMESLKKEYQVLRTLWLSLEQRLGVHHELQQASTKLRISSYDDDPLGLCRSDIPFKIKSMELEKSQLQAELRKTLGQVMYLRSLEKFQHQKEPNKEACPVCTTELGKEWCVFPCAHSFCLDCTKVLTRQQNLRHFANHNDVIRLSCPLCREACRSSELNYVKLHDGTGDGQEGELTGNNHASKIMKVAQTLAWISRNDEGAKALVFSSWVDVLNHISECLKDNCISHHIIRNKVNFQAQMTFFKTSPSVNVLLLPYQSGSKGLNIIEATHVLLVEPVLNLGTELQAIGRVHRLGQTKPITVHRFIVRDTIEERIHALLHTNPQATSSEVVLEDSVAGNLTCEDMKNLLLGGQASSSHLSV